MRCWISAVCQIILVLLPNSCLATDPIQDSESSSNEAGTRFRQPFLDLYQKPASAVYMEGSRVSLVCEAFGSPPPKVAWKYLGNTKKEIAHANSTTNVPPLTASNLEEQLKNEGLHTYEEGGTESTLEIPCMTELEEGVYQCIASNGFQTRYVPAFIGSSGSENLLYPACEEKRIEKGKPAKIYMWTTQRVERAGASVQLNCRGSGIPKPAIKWYIVDEDDSKHLITSNEDFEILPSGDLLVREVSTQMNSLELLCTATNAFGSSSVSPYLFVTKYAGEDSMQHSP